MPNLHMIEERQHAVLAIQHRIECLQNELAEALEERERLLRTPLATVTISPLEFLLSLN